MSAKKVGITVMAIAVFVLVLSISAAQPLLHCGIELPKGYPDAVRQQARGVYSAKVPLVPVYVDVERYAEGTVYYTIRYFPFGTVGMSYSAQDGYNMEKPLTGW